MNKLKRLMMLFMVFALTTVINPLPISANNIDISTSQTNIVKRGYFEARNSKGYTIVNRDGYKEKIILANGVEAFCIEPEMYLSTQFGSTYQLKMGPLKPKIWLYITARFFSFNQAIVSSIR